MKKNLKFIFCVVLSLCILLLACFVEVGVEHKCIGEDCEICRDIALQKGVLKAVYICCLFVGILLTLAQLLIFINLFVSIAKIKLNLVINKVKLTS